MLQWCARRKSPVLGEFFFFLSSFFLSFSLHEIISFSAMRGSLKLIEKGVNILGSKNGALVGGIFEKSLKFLCELIVGMEDVSFGFVVRESREGFNASEERVEGRRGGGRTRAFGVVATNSLRQRLICGSFILW